MFGGEKNQEKSTGTDESAPGEGEMMVELHRLVGNKVGLQRSGSYHLRGRGIEDNKNERRRPGPINWGKGGDWVNTKRNQTEKREAMARRGEGCHWTRKSHT